VTLSHRAWSNVKPCGTSPKSQLADLLRPERSEFAIRRARWSDRSRIYVRCITIELGQPSCFSRHLV
jgi:hypothetical protein